MTRTINVEHPSAFRVVADERLDIGIGILVAEATDYAILNTPCSISEAQEMLESQAHNYPGARCFVLKARGAGGEYQTLATWEVK